MTNDEHKKYLQDNTVNGAILFKGVDCIETQIEELKALKRKLLSRYAKENKILQEGDRIELTWPNGVTQIIDIVTPAISEEMYEHLEYDISYGYRQPNKDGTRAKTGRICKLWQGQLFINGYKKIN